MDCANFFAAWIWGLADFNFPAYGIYCERSGSKHHGRTAWRENVRFAGSAFRFIYDSVRNQLFNFYALIYAVHCRRRIYPARNGEQTGSGGRRYPAMRDCVAGRVFGIPCRLVCHSVKKCADSLEKIKESAYFL